MSSNAHGSVGESPAWFYAQPDLHVVAVDARLYTWFNCPPQWLLGLGWATLIHPDERDRLRHVIDIIQGGDLPAPFVMRIETYYGSVVVPIRVSLWWTHRRETRRRLIGHLVRMEATDYARAEIEVRRIRATDSRDGAIAPAVGTPG